MSIFKSSSHHYGSFYTSPRNGFDMDAQIAREIQRQKLDDEAQRREKHRILTESEEIRNFKSKINAAYLNKERSAQIADTQIRKLEDIKREAELENIMIHEEYKNLEKDAINNMERKRKEIYTNNLVKDQMREKQQMNIFAQQLYQQEREQVEAIIQKTIAEDIKTIENAKKKKVEVYKDMTRSLDLKREKEAYEKYLDEEEARQRHEYLKKRDVRDNILKEKRAQIEAARETFVKKRIDEEDIIMKERALMENLRYELQQDEAKKISDWRARKEVQKRVMQKDIMNFAEQEANEFKSAKLQQEALMEEEYRRYIKEKQAKDDEAERKFALQRKLQEVQLKKEADQLAYTKYMMWQQERDREIMEHEKKKEDERIRQALIRQEKERLMREHLPQLEGFLSYGNMMSSPQNMSKSLGSSPALTKMKHNTSNIFY